MEMADLAGLIYTIGLWITVIWAGYVHKDDYYESGWVIVATSPFWPISWLVMLSISIDLFLYKRYGYVNLMDCFKPSELVYVDSSTEETEK